MKLRKLKTRQAGLVASMRKLSDAAAAEERSLNETEQAQYDEHKAELADVLAAISREEELAELERQAIGEGEPVSGPDPNQSRANDQRWQSTGEFLQAVYRAGTNQGTDRRLISPQAAVSGLHEGVGSEGGFLVQTDMAAELLRRAYNNTQIMTPSGGYAGPRRIPLSANANGVKINAINETSRVAGSRWGGVQVYWKEEGGTPTAKKPDFRQISLELKKLMGLCYATDELLADATALEAVITEAFGEEFAFAIQEALVRGTGAGQPLGILNADCLVSVTRNTASTIKAADLESMYARLWARSIPNSAWFINQDCWPALFAVEDTNGNRLLQMNLVNAPFGGLFGRPIVPIEQCSTLGTVGDIILGDYSQYLWCDKGTMESATSMHVKFTTDEMTFRFIQRVDGRPAWNSALTPYKGSNTQSPFVTLAT